jgi:hypothetical protein
MKETKQIPMHSCVAMWLKTIGEDKPGQPQLINGKMNSLYAQLAKEETEELFAAMESDDLTEICDGLFDSLWCITQLAMMHGININDLTRAGYISNMSKFCKTRQEAIDTVIAYELGTHPNKMGVIIETEFEQMGDLYVIRRNKDGKVMKSINFKEPDFSFITKRRTDVKKETLETTDIER